MGRINLNPFFSSFAKNAQEEGDKIGHYFQDGIITSSSLDFHTPSAAKDNYTTAVSTEQAY